MERARLRPATSPVLFNLVTLLSAAPFGGCGVQSYPMCGNGAVEMGEQCDWGLRNGQEGAGCDKFCKPMTVSNPQVNAAFTLLTKTGTPGYRGTNCEAVGATRARLILEGPSRYEEVISCTRYGKLITNACVTPEGGGPLDCNARLRPGDYKITVTLLRDDDSAVSKSVSSITKNVQAGVPVNLTVDIGQADFVSAYTGSLSVRVGWGAEMTTCTKAAPPVVKQSFRLNKQGAMQPVTGMTLAGTLLDGTEAACYTPMGAIPIEEARDLDWGPYELTIQGFAAGALLPTYCGKYTVFIGPGRNNQPWNPLVPLTAGSDAGACP